MTDAIRLLIQDPDLAGRLSKNGRSFAETCNWPVVLPKWEAFFHEVMEQSI